MKIIRYKNIIFIILFSFVFLYSSVLFAQDIEQIVKKQKPQFNGNINFRSLFYNVNGIQPRTNPFGYAVSGNLNAKFRGINIPISFIYSDQEKKVNQPFNQFGISPNYKWVKVHLGYRNLSFSPFTLAGHTILGAGFELTPKKFRISYMYGLFKRQTNPLDSTAASFNRKGFALKLGYGSSKNFFDLIVLRVADDSNTMDKKYRMKVNAAQNFVTGFNNKFAFSKKLSFESEAALSIYTSNIATEGITVTQYKKEFDILNNLVPINLSSEYYTAIQSAIVYKVKRYSLRFKYKRIDPNYKSMGAYYFNNDMESYTIDPSANFFKQKLNLRASIGKQRNNLRETKQATSLRTVGSVNASYQPNMKFGVDFSYSTFTTNQQAGRNPLIDSLKVYQSTGNISLTPRYMIMREKRNHIITFNYNHLMLNDNNTATSKYTEMNTDNILMNYILALVPEKSSIGIGVSYMKINMELYKNSSYGLTFSASKEVYKDLTVALSQTFFQNIIKDGKSFVFNTNASSQYKINNHHSFQINIAYISNQAGFINNPSFNEFKGELAYVFTF